MSPSTALEQLRHEIAWREDLRKVARGCTCKVCADLIAELACLREALRVAEAWP